MKSGTAMSWNRWPVVSNQTVLHLHGRHEPLPELSKPFIPFGNGRSYSDVCLNEGGVVLDTRKLDKFISFDNESGRLVCEAGVLLRDVLELVVPRGWFLSVTPGTQYVTLGGAIANDVHGKNHHVAGSFGHHVHRLALRRSNGDVIVCGPDLEPEWFAATVGGLGLTGLILWAEIQLMPVCGEMMVVQSQRFWRLDEFWEINEKAGAVWPYTVAWVDCMSARRGGLRGVFFGGKHADDSADTDRTSRRPWSVGIESPFSLVNRVSARCLNLYTFHKERRTAPRLSHYAPYFYPLDGILDWNLLYGRRGFFQYQCVLPFPQGRTAIMEVLQRVARSGESSFLAVLKTFGDARPAGMLSFPRPGITLAVDMPNRGGSTTRLLGDLDAVVLEAGGAVYPAKDPRMSASVFRAGFGRAAEFTRYVDPMISSDFWRRVSA